MNFKINTTVQEIGIEASGFEDENMILLFGNMAPEELCKFCFIVNPHELISEIETGDILIIDENHYTIRAVGNVANENFKNLGHVTLYFNYNETDILGGSIYLNECLKGKLHVNSKISIMSPIHVKEREVIT